MDWFLYDNGLRHESVKEEIEITQKFGLTYFVAKKQI